MRTALFAVALGLGVALALPGDEPSWILAILALPAFPLAASATAARRPGGGRRRAPLGAALVTALSGGFLVGLLVRLAVAAPGWESAASADCGAASTGVQQLVVWSAALVFLLALVPVAAMLASVGARLETEREAFATRAPLMLFPLAVAASGLALIGAGFATTC